MRLRFGEKKEADPTLMYGAVRDGAVDVIVAYTSDGRIAKYGLVLLKDDLHVLPSYDAILLVSARAAAKPGLVAALQPLVQDGGAIDNATMQRANREVDVEGKSPRRVALKLLEAIAARHKESGGRGGSPRSRKTDPEGIGPKFSEGNRQPDHRE